MSDWREDNFLERMTQKPLLVEGAGRCPKELALCAALVNQPSLGIPKELSEHMEHCPVCSDLYRRLSQFEQSAVAESSSELRESLERLDCWFQTYLAEKQPQEEKLFAGQEEKHVPDFVIPEKVQSPGAWAWLFGRAGWGFAVAGMALLVLGGMYLYLSHFTWQQGTQVAEVKVVPSVTQPDKTGSQASPPGNTELTGKERHPVPEAKSAPSPVAPVGRGSSEGSSAERRANSRGPSTNNSTVRPEMKPNLIAPVQPTIHATPARTPELADHPVITAETQASSTKRPGMISGPVSAPANPQQTTTIMSPATDSSGKWYASSQAKPSPPAPRISAGGTATQNHTHTMAMGPVAMASVSPNHGTASGHVIKPMPLPIRLEAGMRVWIDMDSTRGLGDGNFQFNGVLLLPVESDGQVILEKGVVVAGFGSTMAGKTSLRMTEILRNGARYRIKGTATGNTLGTGGRGSVVEFQGGKVAEVWLDSEAVYEAVPGTSTGP